MSDLFMQTYSDISCTATNPKSGGQRKNRGGIHTKSAVISRNTLYSSRKKEWNTCRVGKPGDQRETV